MRKKGSIVGLVVFVCALGLGLHLYRKARMARIGVEIDRSCSEQNLEAIHTGIQSYTMDSDDQDTPPASFEELLREGHLEPSRLISRMSGRDPEKARADENGVLSEPSDYVYIAMPANAPRTLIQAYEKPENYRDSPWGQGTLVLFKLGPEGLTRVEWMDIKQFRQSLTETKKWLARANFKPGLSSQEASAKNLRLIGKAIAYFRNTYSAPPRIAGRHLHKNA